MTKQIISILVFFLNVYFIEAQTKILKPTIKKNPVEILTGNKKHYYQLNKTVSFDVRAYHKVVIYSRKRLQTDYSKYTLSYHFDKGVERSYTSSEIIKDKRTAYTNKSHQSRPSKRLKKTVQIQKGATVLTLENIKDGIVDIRVVGITKNKKVNLKPIEKDVKRISIISGKTAFYYKLNSKIPTQIKVKEPGKLLVYTRKRLHKKGNKKYSFSYTINSKKDTIFVKKAKKAKNSVYKSLKNKKRPSIYHKTVVNIKKAPVLLNFSSQDNVDARFVYKKIKTKQKNKSILPKSSKKTRLLVKKTKKERTYYRLSAKNSFDFNINTDKKLSTKIYVRGEFTYDMHANNDYKIVLLDNDKVINTYKLSCERSKEMKYVKDLEHIPGTLNKITFDIPKGNHKYSIKMKSKRKTALIRMLVQN